MQQYGNEPAEAPTTFALLERFYSLLIKAKKRDWARVLERRLAGVEREAQKKIRASGGAIGRVGENSRILFLCLGNINRSALAERRMKHLLGESAPVASCGFYHKQDRPADPVMVETAGRNGISLENWASRVISRDRVAEADLIFAMESWHLVRLRAEYPESRGRAFLLNCVMQEDPGDIDIADPFGRPPEAYQKCYDAIASATTVLAERILTSRRRHT